MYLHVSTFSVSSSTTTSQTTAALARETEQKSNDSNIHNTHPRMIHRFFSSTTGTTSISNSIVSCVFLLLLLTMVTMPNTCLAFAPPTTTSIATATTATSSFAINTKMPILAPVAGGQLLPPSSSYISTGVDDTVHNTALAIAATTVDPTTALSQVLGGLLGSPAILLIPVLAAFTVASAIAWFIVSYANPADPDDD